jgi:hypothetical protein
VAEVLLYGADVVTALEEVRGDGMAEGVAGHKLSMPASLAARVTARCTIVSTGRRLRALRPNGIVEPRQWLARTCRS